MTHYDSPTTNVDLSPRRCLHRQTVCRQSGHGNDEDPVTGSAHCTLAPYWGGRLGKTELTARQISARGGELVCRLEGDRMHIGGQAVTFATGTSDLADESAP